MSQLWRCHHVAHSVDPGLAGHQAVIDRDEAPLVDLDPGSDKTCGVATRATSNGHDHEVHLDLVIAEADHGRTTGRLMP